MFYGQFIDRLFDRIKLTSTPALRENLGRKINDAWKEMGNVSNVHWEQLKRTGEIVTVPNYTTGTATWTNGSRTVTGTGTWTLAMEGRYFKPQGASNWYKIVNFVNSTELTLLTPIVESSGSGTYTIWKRYYYFPSEVRKVLKFRSWIGDENVENVSEQVVFDNTPSIANTGEPVEFTMFGVDPYESSYSTGNVVLTKDSNVMTGSGTAWLSNVEPGDLVIVSVNQYRVKRVDSDTQIILSNYAISTQSGATYSIRKEDNLGFQLWYNPNSQLILPYKYVKRVYDMVNETYDKPEIPDIEKAILDGAEADRLSDMDDPKWINKQALFSSRVQDAKVNRFTSQPRSRQLRPRIKSRGWYL